MYIFSEDCTTELPYICHAKNICPHGFQRIGSSCYFFSSDNQAPKLSWQSARDFCLTIDISYGQVDLAILGKGDIADQEVLNVIGAKGENVHIGGKNTGNDTWVWLDGGNIPLESYMWQFNNPNNEGNALYVTAEYNKGELADCNENHKWHFVCQLM